MIGAIEFEVTRLMMKAQIHDNIERERTSQEAHTTAVKNIMPNQSHAIQENVSFEGVDRNDPCPCQSGKKFKIVTAVNRNDAWTGRLSSPFAILDKSLESVRLF